MDEVPVFFDLSSGYTYHYLGTKEVSAKRTTGSKQRATFVLCALSNGIFLPPYIIFKNSGIKEELDVTKRKVESTKIGNSFVTQNKTG